MRNSWLCIDANLVIRLVAEPKDETVRELWEQWDAERRQSAAPTLLFYEVSNALYHYREHGLLSGTAMRLALKAALALAPVRRGRPASAGPGPGRAPLAPGRLRCTLPGPGRVPGQEFWTADGHLARAVGDGLSGCI